MDTGIQTCHASAIMTAPAFANVFLEPGIRCKRRENQDHVLQVSPPVWGSAIPGVSLVVCQEVTILECRYGHAYFDLATKHEGSRFTRRLAPQRSV